MAARADGTGSFSQDFPFRPQAWNLGGLGLHDFSNANIGQASTGTAWVRD
ncbi:hypothetical protein ACX801_10160 [Arthrobacter bambusae]